MKITIRAESIEVEHDLILQDKLVLKIGNGSHVVLPKSWRGHKVTILRQKDHSEEVTTDR